MGDLARLSPAGEGNVCDLSTWPERRSDARLSRAKLLAKMPMECSKPFLRWNLIKFVCGCIFSFLLLAAFAPESVAQSPETYTSVAPENIAIPFGEQAAHAIEPAKNPITQSSSASRLEAGDLIEVGVYNVPDLTTKARVNSKGEIYLPLIDYVHVAGLSAEEAEGLIQKRLADGGFVKNPHVTVFVDQYASQGASVLGEVTKPGVYPVTGQQRLLDLISVAGGFTERAGRSITVTHRDQPDKPIILPLARNVSDNPESNIPVLPGDTIIVRKADLVYVVGDVGRPSGFLMDSGHLTVLQAIALAGGTTRTANLGEARIIRKGPQGNTETSVELKKILRAKAPDVTMQPEDILFVPTSAAKVFAGRAAEVAVQAAAAASIIALP
jgi:polysaccharide export outer membrane protein